MADVQRAGRGRLGRTWEAPAGSSLLVSLLLRPRLPVERLHLAAAAVALAATEACFEVAGLRPGLKWPNDLVMGGGHAKVGGILAETDLPAVVVGLGLNLDWPADALPAGAAALGRVDREELLAALLAELETRYGDWAGVSAEYRAACVTVGRSVRVEMGHETLTGTAVDLSDDGHLIVSPTGHHALRTVAAGDVVHVRPQGPD